MSLVDLRVELSASSHSFQIQVPHHASILNVKQQIRRKCPGEPREDGQRVVYRGRFLRDEEKVADIWKSPDDARIIHLAVHPSAWSSEPPNRSVPSTSSPYPSSTPQPRPQQNGQYLSSPPAATPLPFILNKHNTALHVLKHGRLPVTTLADNAQEPALRQHALSVIQSYGWSWPSILDAEYPPDSETSEGLKYERVVIDDHPYLKLATPDASPSPRQKHAIRVLSHTFALLAIPAPDPNPFPRLSPPGMPFTPPNTNLNNHLQQLGLPPLRVVQNPNPNQNPNDPNNPLAVEIRAIPLRALLVPLMMLTFRTVILMYFFSPSKRPLFGVVLSAWILYEAWGAFRAVLGNGDQAGRANIAARQENNRDGGVGQGQNGQRGAAVTPASLGRSQFGVLFDRISNINLSTEDAILDSSHVNGHPEPGLGHRVKTFVGLLVMTLHPAVWDRRRNALRRREGRVRTEANVRDSEPPATPATPAAEGGSVDADSRREQARAQIVARQEQRPRWVREYVQRVELSEWADDA